MSARTHDTPPTSRTQPIGKRRCAQRPSARRGAALFILLVFLGLAAVFITGWLTSTAAERRADRLAAERLQAGWLAESAVERAAAQLSRNAEYQGETWQIPAEQLGGGNNAVITIKIDRENTAMAKQEQNAVVTVVVQLRDGDETVARSRKQIEIRRPKSEESP